MGIGTGRNACWHDVLENGPSSPSARLLRHRLGAPSRGAARQAAAADARRSVRTRARARRAERHVRRRPADAALRRLASCRSTRGRRRASTGRRSTPLTESLGADNPALHEFLSIVTSLQNLPPYTERRPDLMLERHREKEVARRAWRAWWPRRRWCAADRHRPRALQRRAGHARTASISCTTCSSRSPTGCLLAHRVARDQLPALLRRQHARRAARRAVRRCSPRRTRCSKRCSATAWSTACASITRTDCSTRRATSRCCRGCARASPGTSSRRPSAAGARTPALRGGREDSVRGRGAAAPLGRARHDRLQLPQRPQRPVRRLRATPGACVASTPG